MLITGVTGLLGRNVCAVAANDFAVFGVARSLGAFPKKCAPIFLDLMEERATLRCLGEIIPHVIVHCAAMTDVDRCEAEAEAARKLHVDASRTLAEWAAAHKSSFVYISTDSVFDGRMGNYREEDSPAPLNEYGRTKLAGEVAVRSAIPAALILRTNFFGLGGSGRSLAEWILSKLESGQEVKALADVYFNPLPVGFLAKIIVELIKRSAVGAFHVAARDSCSKHKFAAHLAELFGFDAGRLIPISVNEFPFEARRPKNTSLNVGKVSEFLGREMPSVQEGLSELRKLCEKERGNIPRKTPATLAEAFHAD